MDIMITIPKTVDWEEYEKELQASKEGDMLNYRLGNMNPKNLKSGDRCYVVHRGILRGYHIVVDVVWLPNFTCSITGKIWLSGYYVRRTGEFHNVEPEKVTGFRGFRYRHESKPSQIRGLT